MSDRDDNIYGRATRPPVVILAGGAARRMGGADKGERLLAGRRLIDHVVDRLDPQMEQAVISGRHDYGLGFSVIEDRADGPRGPAAGLWAGAHWVSEKMPNAAGFFTVPVDGPFLPQDLVSRLGESGDCAIAVDDNGVHPTFAYWRLTPLVEALAQYNTGDGVALHHIAKNCHAKRVLFPSGGSLMNINTSDDLKHAETLARSV